MERWSFKTGIEKEEYDTFVKNHPLCNLLQSYDWAKVKSNWDHLVTGVVEDGSLVAAGLVLIRRLPLSFCMFYIPKGPILDYSDEKLVHFYFAELKKIARKEHCIFIKTDPGIPVREFTLDRQDQAYFPDMQNILQNIQSTGCIHKGFTTYIEQTVQPRFHMGLKPCDLKTHLPKSTLRSASKAQKKNVTVEEVGLQGLDEFAAIMHMTEERKQVHLRGKEYFRLLLETYPQTAHLYLAYVDPSRKQKELMQRQQQLEARLLKQPGKKTEYELNQVKEALASIEDVCRKYPGKTAIAGGMMIGYGHEYEMLYAGSNEDFMNFRPQYLLYMEQFQYAFDHGARFVTMGGVDGDFKDGLSEFKSNFDPIVREYIGEFDLPVNKAMYMIVNRLLPLAKKMLKRK